MAHTLIPYLFISLTLSPLLVWAQTTDTLKTNQLQSVTVKARRPVIDRQADKTVLNVQADATAAGKSMFEVLQQAPGVTVDPNDNISLAGKPGVNVFIDGKPANLSATDLANFLKNTPSASVDKVELITNPSARFDAQGLAGIINIRFKRDKAFGWNGSVNAGYSQSDHHRANAGGDVNFSAKKLAVFANLSGTDNYQRTNISIDRAIPTSASLLQFRQRGYDSDGASGYTLRSGADYYLSTRQTLGVTLNTNGSRNRFGTYCTTDMFSTGTTPDSSIVNRNDNPNQYRRVNAALNYRYADTLGHELVLDADLAQFRNQTDNVLTNDFYGPLISDKSQLPYARRGTVFNGLTDIQLITLKGDFVWDWKRTHMKIEAGIKSTNVRTDNDLLVFNGRADTQTLNYQQPDANRSTAFRYQENVQAAYLTGQKRWKKWTLQAGIRAEYTRVKGLATPWATSATAIQRPDTSYLNVFPTTFLQYQLNQNSQFQLNYGRRIQRPNYQDMNPFVYPIDPYTSQRGNPYLRPAYTNNLEFSYTYKYAMTVSLNYGHTTQYISDITRRDGMSAYQTVDNVGRVNFLGLSLNTPLPITKWWNGYLYTSLTYNHFMAQLPDGLLNATTWSLNGYMQHSFTLAAKTNLQVSGWYNAPRRETIFYNRGLGSLNLSIRQKIWSERGSIQAGVDDVLNTMRWQQTVAFGDMPANRQSIDLYRKWESRRVYVRLTYRFGNQNIKKAIERSENGALERIKMK